MHVPPFYKRRSWQHFFIGVGVGAVCSYLFFLFVYGEMYHSLHVRHAKLSTELQDVKRQNEALQRDKSDEGEAAFIIEDIVIRFAPSEKVRLNRLQLLTLENMIKEELEPIIGRTVQSIVENEEFVISMLENKRFDIDDAVFQCRTYKLYITNEVIWTVQIIPAD